MSHKVHGNRPTALKVKPGYLLFGPAKENARKTTMDIYKIVYQHDKRKCLHVSILGRTRSSKQNELENKKRLKFQKNVYIQMKDKLHNYHEKKTNWNSLGIWTLPIKDSTVLYVYDNILKTGKERLHRGSKGNGNK